MIDKGMRSSASRKPIVHIPAKLEEISYHGRLFGFYQKTSNEYNVIAWEGDEDVHYSRMDILGEIVADQKSTVQPDHLVGIRQAGELIFWQGSIPCQVKKYQLIQDVFSRNAGILETEKMLRKSVIISGCGSVGSFVALELARSGVGKFLLVDNDTLAYHNLCRHQCDQDDVGKFKVHAVRDRLLRINPEVRVYTYPAILEDVSKEIFDEFCTNETILIGCADNREGDLYGNQIAYHYKIPFLSIGFWERAFAGEIFYAIPGKTPCYACVFAGESASLSARTSSNRRFYTTEADLSETRFEPGISTDISFVTTVGVKMALDLLHVANSGSDVGRRYTPRLLNHLSQFTLICNTNDPQVGGELAEIFAYPLQVTTSIEVDYKPGCIICGGMRNK